MHHRVSLIAFLFCAILAAPAAAQPFGLPEVSWDDREATISLGRDPEPPYCAENPGGTVDISWNIEHTSTPNYVYYKLEDPTRTIILEDETYPGSTGLTVNRTFTIPPGSMNGKYWIRVEYWSFEVGNEANAEVTFYPGNRVYC